jgi:hypothetical protein
MILLLAFAGLAGDSAVLATLRGFSSESDIRESQSVGYYEALINVGRSDFTTEGPNPPPGWLPFSGDQTGIVRELPEYLRWEMKPNLDISWNGKTFRTNSHGFHTPEVSLEKPKGTYRILLFGSSNTMGYGIDAGEEYPRLLEAWLNQWSGNPFRPVELINLAVAGDSPTRRLARMSKEAKRWNADWLWCDATALDPWLEDNHIHSVLQRGISIPFPFVADAVRRSGAKGDDSLEAFRERFRGQSEAMLGTVYAAWSAEAARIGVPLSVVVLPRADGKGKSTRIFQLIKSLTERAGLEVLDISNAFDKMEVDEFRISEWDRHPSVRGHQAMFVALRTELLRRGGFPPPRAERQAH